MRIALALLLVACGRGPDLVMTDVTAHGGGGGDVGGAGGGGGGGGSIGSAGGTAVAVTPPAEADGTLGAWAIDRPLPIARANHCAVAAGDFLLVAGGNYKPAGAPDFVSNDDVLAARVGDGGKLGAWRVVGRLPSPGVDCVLAVSGKTIVLLGGLFADNMFSSRVFTARLGDDATLSEWKDVGALPYGRRALGAGAWLEGTKLWLSDSLLPSEGAPEAVLAAATLQGDALSEWRATPYSKRFRGKPLGAFSSEAAFIIGGYGEGNAVLPEVVAVPFRGAAQAVPVTPLPEARAFGAAAAAGDWVFVTGGRTQIFGVAPSAATYSAKLSGSTLGLWTARTSMPQIRSNHTATVVRDWLYVAGGGAGAGGLDTVFRARVKHPARVQ